MRPRLLDLFCGAGGAAMGYHRAGFDVVGVDINPQPHYPFEFHQADAQTVLSVWRDYGSVFQRDFAAVHASPPCQRYTKAAKIRDSSLRHPDLVAEVRQGLERIGLPWVIENVVGAPLLRHSLLCGTMFGLKVFRHRLFEASFVLMTPPHPKHDGNTGATDGYSTLARGRNGYICVAGNNYNREQGAAAMEIDWPMNRRELSNAIPPAYTEFIGRQLIAALECAA